MAVLTGLAVAQPIYDLLSRSPEFLPVHGAELPETVLLAVSLSLLLPLAWAAATHLVDLEAPAAGRTLHDSSIYLLAAAFFLQLADVGQRAPITRVVLMAVLLTSGFVLLDRRTGGVRRLLLYLSPTILVFPLVFLTRPGVRAVLFPPAPQEVVERQLEARTPVVFVVFDGLPLTSLLEEEGRIDPVRYPAFARLASAATWYRQATSVADNTLDALPALLSGRLADQPLPTAAYYPRSLFRLLGSSHRMVVDEPLTRLCPPDLCRPTGPGFGARTSALLSDLAVVYLHLLVPERLGHRLPQIQTSWRGFLALARPSDKSEPDRAARFRALVERVDETAQPALFFIHSELPHAPHAYLPSGEVYTATDNEPSGEGRQFAWWSDDDWAVIHSYQRHLLQVGFTDRLLGELLAALDRDGLFDPALIVVTSDHGVSFRPGGSRRLLEAENAHDVLSIPLLIKLPGQTEGGADDRPVQLIDVLPTIVELFGADRRESRGGHSLLDADWPGRSSIEVDGTRLDRSSFEAQGKRSLASKIALFGTGSTHGTFVRHDPFPELLGRPTTASDNGPISPVEALPQIETGPDLLPIQVTGAATLHDDAPVCLAIAGDGAIRATTCAYRGRPGASSVPWSVLLERPLEDPSTLELFVIDESSPRARLARAGGTTDPLSPSQDD